MPGMDGLTMLQAIKTKWPETEVVIITGYPSAHAARAAVKLGAFDYLTKPVTPAKVVAVANAAMTQRIRSLAPAEMAARNRDAQKGWAKYLD